MSPWDCWTTSEDGAGSLPCPVCGAGPGQQCSDRDGTERGIVVHADRGGDPDVWDESDDRELVRVLREEAGLPPAAPEKAPRPAPLLVALRTAIGDETLSEAGAVRYVREALAHRTRASGWLAELDDALGFSRHLTQDGGEGGENAQGARLQRIRSARPRPGTDDVQAPRAECRPRIPVVVFGPDDTALRLELYAVPRVGDALELAPPFRWWVERVIWYPDRVELRTRYRS